MFYIDYQIVALLTQPHLVARKTLLYTMIFISISIILYYMSWAFHRPKTHSKQKRFAKFMRPWRYNAHSSHASFHFRSSNIDFHPSYNSFIHYLSNIDLIHPSYTLHSSNINFINHICSTSLGYFHFRGKKSSFITCSFKYP